MNEDYIGVDMNVTFTSGQNAPGDSQQCFYITILNDNILECNETFDVVIMAVTDDENVVNVTAQVITVTIEEDPNDCKPITHYCITYIECSMHPLYDVALIHSLSNHKLVNPIPLGKGKEYERGGGGGGGGWESPSLL